MFGSVRVIIMAVLFFGIAGAGVYVMKLRSDNAILKANQVLLEQSVESQKQVIQKQQQDFSQILESNKKMKELGRNDVNKYELYIRFSCQPETTI